MDLEDGYIDCKNEYVFLRTDKVFYSELSLETQNFLKDTKHIHLYQINGELFDFEDKLNNSNLYLYCFNKRQENFCLQNGYIPHFCFLGLNILDISRQLDLVDLKNIDNNIEVFWFPNDEVINLGIEDTVEILNTLKTLNTPICVSFSKIFNNSLSTDKYMFLENICKGFDNPLYFKELDLLEHEKFSEKNFFIDDTKNIISNIVLGIFGDESVKIDAKENIIKQSFFNLRKNKKCLTCEFFEHCGTRGLGIIMLQNNIFNCIGIKKFKQN